MRLPFELKGGVLLSISSFLMLACAFPVQILVARYLGPEDLGIYAFLLSIGSFARAIAALGMENVVIPIYKRQGRDSLLGTALLLRKAAGILVMLTALCWVGICHWQASQEQDLAWLVLLVVSAYLFTDHEIFSFWCKSEGHFKSFVAVDLGGTLIGLSIRLALVGYQSTMFWLLASYLLEQIAKLAISLVLYLRSSRPFLRKFEYSRSDALTLAARGWPVWLSSLMSVAYARFDQVLLGTMIADSSELGQYSVAYRLVEALSAGAIALFVVYLPILSKDPDGSQTHLQRLHDLTFWAFLLLGTGFFFAIEPTVLALYGSRFESAARLSLIYLLILPTTYLGLCRSAFLYSRNLQKLELGIKSSALILAVLLNLILIPRYGALGATGTAILVGWMSLVVPNFLLPSLRPVLICTLRAAVLPQSFLRLFHWLRRHPVAP